MAHSRSPAIHNAAYAALGLDWMYVAFRVAPGGAAGALDAMRRLQIAGLNVTMPHKEAVAAACDDLTERAVALSAVNTVVPRDDGLLGDSTDGPGFVAALADDGVDVAGRRALVLGAGGAARAIVLALGRAGAEVTVAARRPEQAAAAAGLAPGAEAVDLRGATQVLPATEILVQATPVGMAGEPPLVDVDRLPAHAYVAETIYHPAETRLLAAARARGLPGSNGLGLLVHQAALSFCAMTGIEAPLEVMRQAAGSVAQGGAQGLPTL